MYFHSENALSARACFVFAHIDFYFFFWQVLRTTPGTLIRIFEWNLIW